MTPMIAGFGYHEITDEPSASGFQRPGARPYTLTPRAFAEHLDQMAASAARPMRVTDIDFTRPDRCLVLTFDDGGKSAVHAGDALARRGWRGHFFIVSSLIGTRTFATAGDIRYLESCGHIVGTHSHTHPDIFPDLTRSWAPRASRHRSRAATFRARCSRRRLARGCSISSPRSLGSHPG